MYLKDIYKLKRLFGKLTNITNYTGGQGLCVTDKYIVVGVVDGINSHNTLLYVYDKNTYSLVSSLPANPINSYSLGHCNCMTYNSKTNQIVVSNTDNTISFVDANTFNLISRRTYTDSNGIGYNSDLDLYAIHVGRNTIDICNGNFNKLYSFPISDCGLTVQGMDIYNGLIFLVYYDCGTAGSYQPTSNPDTKYCGAIFVYTMEGVFEKSYLLPNSLSGLEGTILELEDISYLENGRFALSYNTINASWSNFEVWSIELMSSLIFDEEYMISANNNIPGYENIIPTNSDLDDYTKQGIYRINGTGVGGTLTNYPSTVNGKLIVEYINNISYIMQTVLTRNNNIFTRIRDNSNVWSNWKHIQGIISGKVTVPITAVNTTASVYVDLRAYGLTQEPQIAITPYTGSPQNVKVSIANVTTTGFNIIGYRTDSVTPFSCHWILVNNS